jgi:hypothetical protein
MANFNGSGHQRLVMDTPPFAAGSATNPGFVDLDVLVSKSTDPVLIGAHHGGAQLVKQAEGRLISAQAKLPLELHRRHALRLTGKQISCPEPDAERHMAALHDRADQKPRLAATGAAFQISRSRGDAERFADYPAVTADKSLRPTSVLKIGSARRVTRKVPLKLRQRPRKSQIVALKNVHRRHDTIRPSRSSGETTSSGCLAQTDRHALFGCRADRLCSIEEDDRGYRYKIPTGSGKG